MRLHRVKPVHELVHVLFAGPEDDAGKGGLVDGVGESLRLQREPAVLGVPRAALSNERSVQKIAWKRVGRRVRLIVGLMNEEKSTMTLARA